MLTVAGIYNIRQLYFYAGLFHFLRGIITENPEFSLYTICFFVNLHIINEFISYIGQEYIFSNLYPFFG